MMKFKSIVFKALLLFVSLAFSLNAGTTKKIKDFADREVELPTKIEKIVTLGSVGVLNCFVFAMDEGDKIANALPPRFSKTDRWKYHLKFNPELKTKPVVEDAESSIIMEELLKVNPDVIFTMNKKQAQDAEAKGLKAVVLTWKNASDAKDVVNLLGEIFNKPQRAQKYTQYFDDMLQKINNAVSKVSQDKRVTALNTTLKRLALGHIIGEWWIEQAGGVSVSKDIRISESQNYSLEQLLVWDPDFLLVQTKADKEFAYSDARFKNLKAVKNNKVFVTPVFGHVWANRTMEQPLTVLWAAKLFYPDAMKDISLKYELKKFSKEFFSYELSDEECDEILGVL
ncbi:ABC transporter substrate-binding protein [Campylobacter sp. RM16187]|uniref:ABC transporter substrate-binding protein n=1 Tax=Campylobacter sp. RM16187 TaxID=1660063 RepID=UPI0021B53927|nr:ABC transporter substrate-binding protein [Campylobacter sp. RM16187]QKG29957.1 iron ABC transporter, periplasmic iron-binding protein [Campylobacter sp. RM16187]